MRSAHFFFEKSRSRLDKRGSWGYNTNEELCGYDLSRSLSERSKNMKEYFLAIDGGGTKTEGVLCTPDGKVLRRALGGPSNANDIGIEKSLEVLSGIVRELLLPGEDEIPRLSEASSSLFVGIAGALNRGEELRTGLSLAFPELTISVGTDARNLLSSELYMEDGACIIAGTGSVSFVRMGDDLSRIGGWGYLIDDAGSGYDIGREALSRAFMEFDGRREKTTLLSLLTDFLGCELPDALSRIYAEGRPFIASIAPIILERAETGDAECYAIVEKSIECWGQMIERAYEILGKPFRCVLGGGIFTNCKWLEIDLAMNVSSPVELSIATAPPVYGAFVECAAANGITEFGKPIRNAFLRSYRAIVGEPWPDDEEDED